MIDITKEAMFYETKGNVAHCRLCPISCKIKHGHTGLCNIRKNENGILYAKHYGKIAAISLDPIEKKPLYHFESGAKILSIGGLGCNFRCPFCQNHSISMGIQREESLTAQKAVQIAKDLMDKGNIGIAYTYNEPFINYEYMYDVAVLIYESGMKNVIVTNGYVNIEPLTKILPFIHAMNIDLKGYSNRFYNMVGGNLESVKKIIEYTHDKCHLEITTLIIPDENDSIIEMEEMSQWIAKLNADIPLHLTRFFPNYKMRDKKPTPIDKLEELAKCASKHLNRVYIGNV